MSTDEFTVTDHEPVVFVNTFTVTGEPEEFEHVFAEVSEFMAKQPGFIEYKLCRHVDKDKQDKYVNIALWTDADSWRNAVAHEGFQGHAQAIRARSTNDHSLYVPRQSYSAK